MNAWMDGAAVFMGPTLFTDVCIVFHSFVAMLAIKMCMTSIKALPA